MNLKFDLSSVVDNKSKYALIFIDFSLHENVADVIIYICKIYGLNPFHSKEKDLKYALFEDKWYIPSNQSSSVLKNIQGILKVEYSAKNVNALTLESPDGTLQTSSFETSTLQCKKTRNLDEVLSKDSENVEAKDPKDIQILGPDKQEKKKRKKNLSKESLHEECSNASYQFDRNAESESMHEEKMSYDIQVLESKPKAQKKKKKEKLPKVSKNEEVTEIGFSKPSEEAEIMSLPNENVIQCKEFSDILPEEPLQSTHKRKRKHKSAKKKQSSYVQNPEQMPLKSTNVSETKLSSLFSGSHTIFNEEEEGSSSSRSSGGLGNLTVSNSNMPSFCGGINSYVWHSSPNVPSQLSNGTPSYCNSSKRLKRNSESPRRHQKSLESTDKTIKSEHFAKENASPCNNEPLKVARDPPIGIHEPQTLSSDDKIKFKKLLELEHRDKTMYFRGKKTLNYSLRNESLQDYDSLPLSFSSRKHNVGSHRKNWNPFSEESSLNSKNVSLQDTPTVAQNELTPLSVSSEVNYLVEPAKFTGIKAKKNNTSKPRFSQSTGNLLSLLKKTPKPLNTISDDTQSLSNFDHPSDNNVLEPEPKQEDEPTKLELNSEKTLDLDIKSVKNDSGLIENSSLNSEHSASVVNSASEIKNEYEDSSSSQKHLSENKVKDSLTGEVEVTQDLREAIDVEKQDLSPIPVIDLESLSATDVDSDILSKLKYESFPLISKLPHMGDIIAFKTSMVDECMRPCYSVYRPAKVVSQTGLQVELLLLDAKENESSKNPALMDWRDVMFPRLVYP